MAQCNETIEMLNTSKQIEKIFPDEFVSGSVTNQKELDDAFLKHPDFSKEYIQIALYWKETRKWYEENWPKVSKYLDKNFLDKFKTEKEHYARAWEFHLASVFLERGLKLKEKTWEIGPDFCIITSVGKKIWVEAIICDLGITDPVEPRPVLQPGRIYSFGGNIEDTNRTRALRITNAIGTKFEKFNLYLTDTRSGVKNEDCFLVAINGDKIQHMADPSMLFKRAVFGQGPEVLVRVPGQEKLQSGFYKPTPIIIKKKEGKEEEIPANFLEMNEFSKISVVLYCGHGAPYSWMNGFHVGDDFMFAYHSNPQNSIPENTFMFGHGIKKDSKTGTIEDKEQVA